MTPSKDREWPSRRMPRRIFWPAALIFVGVVFLLHNLGMLPGEAGQTLLRLWPLALVLIGIDSLLDREGVAGATFMIGLGAALLLINLGYLALDPWSLIFSIWPALVMAWGIDLIVGRRAWWLSLLGALAMLVVLGASIAVLSGQIALPGTRGQNLTTRQDLSGAKQGRMAFSLPAGVLKMSAAESGVELTGFHSNASGTVVEDFNLEDGLASYAWSAEPSAGVAFPYIGGGPAWVFRLPIGLPLDIRVEQGAAGSTLNLSGVDLQELDAEFGVGRMQVSLPAADATVKLSGGVGVIGVILPESAGVRITRRTGIVLFSLPDGYQKDGDVYLSPNYATAQVKIDITEISLGVGIVQVITAAR